jgi:chorismate mutase
MNKLSQLRNIIASLDETLVKACCGRSLFRVNEGLYNELKRPLSVAETATLFGAASTIAGRAHILRPLYINTLLPVLCAPGEDADRRKCIASDASCMNALVQRLNLSVHVAALKLEEIPDSLRLPLQSRDPVQLEDAITNHTVEAEVIARVLDMTREQHASAEIPDKIARLYAEWIIPISRKIQVHDLLAARRP